MREIIDSRLVRSRSKEILHHSPTKREKSSLCRQLATTQHIPLGSGVTENMLLTIESQVRMNTALENQFL